MGHNSRRLLKSFNFYSVSVSCCQHIFYIDFSLIKDPKDLRYVMIYSSQLLLLLELNLDGEEPMKFFTFNSLGEVAPLIFVVGIEFGWRRIREIFYIQFCRRSRPFDFYVHIFAVIHSTPPSGVPEGSSEPLCSMEIEVFCKNREYCLNAN